MSAEKDIALVIRFVEFSESSGVVTLFTRRFGKVSTLAKGARRLKGPFESALDLLAHCRIVFLHKSSDALDLLTEAKLVRRFRPPAGDLAALYAGYYVAELLSELTDEYDPHPELFDLADSTLEQLRDGGPVADLILWFELQALRELGHLPSLDTCVECGAEVAVNRRVASALTGGGVLCPRCRTGVRNVVSVSADVLTTMRNYSSTGGIIPAENSGGPMSRKTRGELRGIINHYLSHLLGKKLKLHEFLGTLTAAAT